MKIEEGKYYKLDNGCKYICYKVYESYGYINGAYQHNNTQIWEPISHYSNGNAVGSPYLYYLNILSPWIEKPHVEWSLFAKWHNALAMDENGDWHAFEKIPKPTKCFDLWNLNSSDNISTKIPFSFCPKFEGSWKDSLIIRPGYKENSSTCDKLNECDYPPKSWKCTRDKNHEGPCAAFKVEKTIN